MTDDKRTVSGHTFDRTSADAPFICRDCGGEAVDVTMTGCESFSGPDKCPGPSDSSELYDSQTQAHALLADAGRVPSLIAELAAAHKLLAEWQVRVQVAEWALTKAREDGIEAACAVLPCEISDKCRCPSMSAAPCESCAAVHRIRRTLKETHHV
jgi:hypothetical protein